MKKELDIIIPISFELDWPTKESIVQDIRYQKKQYGFTKFALAAPCGGWRSIGYPPREVYEKLARLFASVKEELEPEGIHCGWWNTLTIKSGPSEDFVRMVRSDGTLTPFASCPLDPSFRKRFSEDVALFARIGKPEFIYFEDDYSISAAAGSKGCFCKYHLAEFAAREGREYSREELSGILSQRTPEAIALHRRWKKLMRDSLVGLSETIRAAVDRETPEIPIGYMQAGGCDLDGDVTEAVSRALAGKRHVPFSRLFGTFYGGVEPKSIPERLYHPLYSRQHINGEFTFYHESDTFPHTRFFTAGKQMFAIQAIAYSYKFDGSTFQTQQLLDDPNEESAYGKNYAQNRKFLNELRNTAESCELCGVEIGYDPFYSTLDISGSPAWVRPVSLFGIPYITKPSRVAFWDVRRAVYAEDKEIMEALSKGLFLDGEAAKCLVHRGYGAYIGVELGEDVASEPLRFDLGAREVICAPFDQFSRGKNMPSAHMLARSNGKLLKMTVTDPACEVISEFYSFRKELITPAMTRFVNKLGGHVVVMGMTVANNLSQSLFNYRRKKLFEELLIWCGDAYVFVREAPNVSVVMNEAVNPVKDGFYGMLTLTNLCEDPLESVRLHLPEKWKNKNIQILNKAGEWNPVQYRNTEDGVEILSELIYLEAAVLKFI